MRTLIVGATGLIGSNLAAACDDRGLAHAGTCYRKRVGGYATVDVRDTEAMTDLIREYEPEVVFLAAGSGDPDAADAFPDDSRDVTIGGTTAIAQAVRNYGGTLVAFSTDRVFGPGANPRKEDDAAAPATSFGRNHAAAEAIVRDTLPGRHLIVRTTSVFGPSPRPAGFVHRVKRTLATGDRFAAAADRFIQPTFAPDLANTAFALLDRGYIGTFHVAGPDRLAEYSLAKLVAFAHGYDADMVRSVAGSDQPAAWLDRSRVRTILGLKAIRQPADGLRAMRTAVPAVAVRAA